MICDIYDGLASMCLKVVLGTKCQRSRFRDKGSMVERMLIPCNKTVNLIDLLSEMMFGGFTSSIHRDLLMNTLGC